MVLIQSKKEWAIDHFILSCSVSIGKIAGGGERGLVIMLFIYFSEKITNVSGNS